MHQITELSEEFYGVLSSRMPFNSLEKLEFAKMREWKKWHVLGIGEFPALQDLAIDDCPNLIGRLPENLCSLTRLKISKCQNINLETPIQLSSLKYFEVSDSPRAGVLFEDAELFSSQLQGMNQLMELGISGCDSLTSLPISKLLNTLKEIRIYRCGKLRLEPSDGEMISSGCGDMFVDTFTLQACDSIDALVVRAHEVSVDRCHGLTKFLIPTGTEDMEISNCDNLERFSVAYETQNTSLYSLEIRSCKKLKSLPERMKELLPSLKNLEFHHCPEIESFPEGGLPFNLEVLHVRDCKKLKSLPEQMQELLPSLKELNLSSCPEIESFPEGGSPFSLEVLNIEYCKKLKSLPERMQELLPSLKKLTLLDCPEIESFPEGGLPFSLEVLHIWNCKKLVNGRKEWCLQRLPCLRELRMVHDGSDEEIHWELPCSIRRLTIDNLKTIGSQVLKSLTSLEYLQASNLPQIWSLVEEGLPSSLSELLLFHHDELHSLPTEGLWCLTSLQSLSIYSCSQLQSIPESVLPSSLSTLSITFCPNLQSLPLNGMPSSLSRLDIYDCPNLNALIEFEKGDY